jgi:hypothetical protein
MKAGRDRTTSAAGRALGLALLLVAAACASKRSPHSEASADDGAEVTYEEACSDESRRSEYVKLVLEKAKPRIPDYLTSVEYMSATEFAKLPTRSHLEAGAEPALVTLRDVARATPPYQGNQKSRLIVLAPAFEKTRDQAEIVFLLGFLDHELVHVDQAMHGLRHELLTPEVMASLQPSVAEKLYDTVSELSAYRNEIAASRQYALSAAYYQEAYGAYLFYYLRLFDSQLTIPDRVRHALMIEMFADWMRKQDQLFAEEGGRWYFRTPMARYQVPPTVVRELQR